MKDLQNILRRLQRLEEESGACVLATVVEVSGSAYRGPGTRMLVEARGESLGSISGGCLEGNVREQALEVLADGEPRLLTYDSTSEDDILWGTGLGCSGVVHVLLERLPAKGPQYTRFLAGCLFGCGPGVLATVYRVEGESSARAGQHLLLGEGICEDDIADPALRQKVLGEARAELGALRENPRPLAQGQSRHYALERGRVDALLEPVLPPVPLVLFGAGYDARPVARLAAELGWRVAVCDHRPSFVRPERFPEARAALLAAPGQLPEGLALDARTAALVMSHNYLQDLAVLRQLLSVDLAYLGVLGPRQRTQRLLDELRGEGIEPTDLQRERLFSPVGLDIGAETAEEIALSVVAEMQAVLAGRRGGLLRERQAPIHDRASR